MNSQSSEQFLPITWSRVPIYSLVGILVCTFSLNGVLKKIAESWNDTFASQILLGLAIIPENLYKSLPGGDVFLFELLVRWLFLSLALFLLLLLLNSLRLKSAAVLCSGVGGLSLGVFLFTWVSLAIYLILFILSIIGWLISWISYILSAILSAIVAILLWSPVFYGLVGLGILGGIVFLISISGELWQKLMEFLNSGSLLKKLLAGSLALGLLAGAVYLFAKIWEAYLKPLLEIIKVWLEYYLVPILVWIVWLLGMALAILFLGGLILLSLVILGYQYCDQFFNAKNCGRSTYKAFDTGFSIGVVIAVVFLICSATPNYLALINASWNSIMPIQTDNLIGAFHALMPAEAETLLQSLFLKAALPIFDVASLVIVLFLANSSLVMSLISGTIQQPLRGLFRPERMPAIFLLIFGALVAFAVPLLDSILGEDG